MPHSFSDRAIVLRVWSVGETDRFCILLTERHGRISVRVPGARRETSRRGRGLLPFHIADVTWTERSDVHFVTAASCVAPNAVAWTDPEALEAAQQGIALVMRYTEEGVSLPEIFVLTEEFLSVCDGQSSSVLDLFIIKLLRLLGSFPSASHSLLTNQRFSAHDSVVWSSENGGFVTAEDDPYGLSIDTVTHRILAAVDTLPLRDTKNFPTEVSVLLRRIVQGLVPIQLGTSVPIVSAPAPRILASSSAVTPT